MRAEALKHLLDETAPLGDPLEVVWFPVSLDSASEYALQPNEHLGGSSGQAMLSRRCAYPIPVRASDACAAACEAKAAFAVEEAGGPCALHLIGH